MSKTIAFAAAFALAALTTGATMAEARGGHGRGHGFHGHHGHHGHHHRRHFSFAYAAPIYVAPVYEGCGYAYARWQSTGSFHWKKKYYICKGWY